MSNKRIIAANFSVFAASRVSREATATTETHNTGARTPMSHPPQQNAVSPKTVDMAESRKMQNNERNAASQPAGSANVELTHNAQLDARLRQKYEESKHHTSSGFCNPWPSYRHPGYGDVVKL